MRLVHDVDIRFYKLNVKPTRIFMCVYKSCLCNDLYLSLNFLTSETMEFHPLSVEFYLNFDAS